MNVIPQNPTQTFPTHKKMGAEDTGVARFSRKTHRIHLPDCKTEGCTPGKIL